MYIGLGIVHVIFEQTKICQEACTPSCEFEVKLNPPCHSISGGRLYFPTGSISLSSKVNLSPKELIGPSKANIPGDADPVPGSPVNSEHDNGG